MALPAPTLLNITYALLAETAESFAKLDEALEPAPEPDRAERLASITAIGGVVRSG